MSRGWFALSFCSLYFSGSPPPLLFLYHTLCFLVTLSVVSAVKDSFPSPLQVLVNDLNGTRTYVMWMYVDNEEQSLKLAGVATSPWANGPYVMHQTLRPDGNLTIDMTAFQYRDTGKVREFLQVLLGAQCRYESSTSSLVPSFLSFSDFLLLLLP